MLLLHQGVKGGDGSWNLRSSILKTANQKMGDKKGEYKRAFKALEQSLANILDQVNIKGYVSHLIPFAQV